MLRKFIPYALCSLFLLESAVVAADFRFSTRPNKAHLIQWRVWGTAVLAEARKADKLVLLSLSAVWCHWCHVMDETTYSDEKVIAYINENFVPVRVDADLRPDIDSLYNQGGWPSTVILTPEGEIVTGGNYIPPGEMLEWLARAADVYRTDREAITRRIELSGMLRASRSRSPAGYPAWEDVDTITDMLKDGFDKTYGGFGTGQKFPNATAIDFLLARVAATGDRQLKSIITATLDAMAKGAIRDRVEGGFFRYAVKPDWSEPHYEKMLDVNAGAIWNYASAALAFGRKDYRRIARESIDYVRRTLSDGTTGAFFGSQDADETYYSKRDRKGMKPPFVDRTVYADSSSLMISALIAAAGATGRKDDLHAAEQAAEFLVQNLYAEGKGIAHFFREGTKPFYGLLADNVLFGSAMLDLYNATGRRHYLMTARRIGDFVVEKFPSAETGRFRTSLAASTPAPMTAGTLADVNDTLANYRALSFLGRLLRVASSERARAARDAALVDFSGEYRSFAPAAAAYGDALLWALGEPLEITIVGFARKAEDILSIANAVYIPRKVVRVLSLDRDAAEIKRLNYPLREAVYLCAGKRCSAPIVESARFEAELKRFLGTPAPRPPSRPFSP